MGTPYIYDAAVRAAKKAGVRHGAKHLDIGAAAGQLIGKYRAEFGAESFACDYTDTLMELPDQKVDIADLNVEKLPYADNAFDVVTATEIIEHLENPREFLRDIARVLKPGGLCVISTPNVLNLNSRLRYLWFGFHQLFGPLPVGARKLESTDGHITPFSYFYCHHAMLESGYEGIDLFFDRMQRSNIGKLLFLWLPIRFFGVLIGWKERHKYKTIDDDNAELVRRTNSIPMLVSRHIIVSGVKR